MRYNDGMTRFSKYSAVTITIAIVLFLIWLIVKTAGGNSLAVNILGVITVFFCVISLLTIPKDKSVPKDAKVSEDANVKDWDKMVLRSFPLLITLVLVTYFLEVTLKITWFPEAIVAYGTLFLAYATFQLGQTTKNENAKLLAENILMREATIDRENHDRQERLLLMVIDWIMEIKEYSLVEFPNSSITGNNFEIPVKFNRTMRGAKALTRGEVIESLASRSFDGKLLKPVKTVLEDLVLMLYFEYENDNAFRGSYTELINTIKFRIATGNKSQIVAEYFRKIS